MADILIYPHGTEIVLKSSNIDAIITAATIRGETVVYECQYWYESELSLIPLYECQFDVKDKKVKKKINRV